MWYSESYLRRLFVAELGDYDPEEHVDNYIADFKLLLKQTPKIEEKIAEIHQTQMKYFEMNFYSQ